jgi:dUTP pyrophosphatase
MGREEREKRSAPTVLVERLPHAEGLPLPEYGTPGAAGADICAAVNEPVAVSMGSVSLIPTGLKLAIPEGFEVQVRPRSGLALRSGLTLVNAPGTIDSDYRGEVKVIVTCVVDEPCIVRRGDRIAQMIIAPVSTAGWQETGSLPETLRGTGGFGHTGVHMEEPTA